MLANQSTIFVVSGHLKENNTLLEVISSMQAAFETFDSPQDFLDFYQRGRPGCLVLDIKSSRSFQFELLEKLSETGRELPAIIITSHGTPAMVVRAFQFGATDFIEHPVEAKKLMSSIHYALSVDSNARKRLAMQSELEAKLASFSKQEAEVMEMIVAGKSGKEIASHLDVSLRTVEFRRSSIHDKTETASLSELINLVVALENLQRRNILPHRYFNPHLRMDRAASGVDSPNWSPSSPPVLFDSPSQAVGQRLESG